MVSGSIAVEWGSGHDSVPLGGHPSRQYGNFAGDGQRSYACAPRNDRKHNVAQFIRHMPVPGSIVSSKRGTLESSQDGVEGLSAQQQKAFKDTAAKLYAMSCESNRLFHVKNTSRPRKLVKKFMRENRALVQQMVKQDVLRVQKKATELHQGDVNFLYKVPQDVSTSVQQDILNKFYLEIFHSPEMRESFEAELRMASQHESRQANRNMEEGLEGQQPQLEPHGSRQADRLPRSIDKYLRKAGSIAAKPRLPEIVVARRSLASPAQIPKFSLPAVDAGSPDYNHIRSFVKVHRGSPQREPPPLVLRGTLAPPSLGTELNRIPREHKPLGVWPAAWDEMTGFKVLLQSTRRPTMVPGDELLPAEPSGHRSTAPSTRALTLSAEPSTQQLSAEDSWASSV